MTTTENNLEKSILATLAYFDIFSYPLTELEIWKWLWQMDPGCHVNFDDVKKTLKESDWLKNRVDVKWGFYFLKNREEVIDLRRDRYNFSEVKFKKAKRVARFLKFIPGILMIAVCNSLSWENVSAESDIDFFIVTKRGSIWLVRFLATGFMKIFGLRPSGLKTKDTICLSFFVDEENLDMRKVALSDLDVYLVYWVAQLMPIYDRDGTYKVFFQENQWVKKYLPNVFLNEAVARRQVSSRPDKKTTSRKGSWLESIFKKIQMAIFPREIKELANKDSRVIITDGILKFHCNDRREEYKNRWIEKIEGIKK